MIRSRHIAVVTTGRSDYGLLRPVFRALRARRGVRAQLIVTGMHLSRRLGLSVREIQRDGLLEGATRVPALLAGDSPREVAQSLGRTTLRFGALFGRKPPSIVVLLGDRFETLGVAAATLPFNIPLAHVHGGELSEGATDDAIRHAISKLSHLHFVSAAPHAQRLRQMGEEPWRITVAGAPGLDEIDECAVVAARDLERRFGVPVDRRTLLVTYHPETRRRRDNSADLRELLAALSRAGRPVLFTAPNADPGRDALHRQIAMFTRAGSDRAYVDNLGREQYLSLMRHVGAMVGNSSSGLIEAPSFRLPVVNVGDRQGGRLRAANVIDVAPERRRIAAAIGRALDPAFRAGLHSLRNPYGDGRAASRIAARLASVAIDDALLTKRFVDRVYGRAAS